MRKAGFTLIELLVVIAIIAILAAILFPVFAQAREKARAITCLSNEKQMGLAMMQYVQDYDENYFPANYGYTGPSGTVEVRWYDMVQPYVKNGSANSNGLFYGQDGIWHCPSFPSDQNAEYGVQEYIFPGWTGGVAPAIVLAGPVTSDSELDSPANTIVVMEKGQQDGNSSWPFFNSDQYYWTGGVGNPPGSYQNPHNYEFADAGLYAPNHHNCDQAYSATTSPNWGGDYGNCGTSPRWRHQGTTNAVFGDGHVKAMQASSINWGTNIYVQAVWNAHQNPPGTPAPIIPDTGTGPGPG